MGRPTQIELAVLNLAINARVPCRAAAPSGHHRQCVGGAAARSGRAARRRLCRVCVSDTGTGMSARCAPRCSNRSSPQRGRQGIGPRPLQVLGFAKQSGAACVSSRGRPWHARCTSICRGRTRDRQAANVAQPSGMPTERADARISVWSTTTMRCATVTAALLRDRGYAVVRRAAAAALSTCSSATKTPR